MGEFESQIKDKSYVNEPFVYPHVYCSPNEIIKIIEDAKQEFPKPEYDNDCPLRLSVF